MRVYFHRAANAGAGWAGAEGAVEGKEMRFDFRQADVAVRAGKVLTKGENFVRLQAQNMDDTLTQLGCRFQGIRQAHEDTILNDQAVDNDFDGVLLILFHRNVVGQEIDLAVDADAHVAVLDQAGQELLVRPLAPVDDRRHDHDFFPCT